MAKDSLWEATKNLAQNAFDDVAQSYQDILIRGHLLPNRNIDMEIAEGEYDKGNPELINPEQDVSNTEIDDWYKPER